MISVQPRFRVVARMVGCGGVTTPDEDLSSAVIVPVVDDVGE
jgi:Asp/Glu/hydantoin racemase